jgi:CMP-N-acetylneuraminic acid synthetase
VGTKHIEVLGIIPARGGSKGIPRKNLTSLAGKQLIQYTFDAALHSKELDSLLLSTDDQEIAEAGRKAGVDVPFMRPASLAGDTTPMLAVVQHALEHMEGQGSRVDAVMVLQPTSPLRTSTHIDEAIRLYQSTMPSGVVSVCEVKEHPYELVALEAGHLRRSFERPAAMSRRQDYPAYYYVNGAIYLVSREAVAKERSLIPPGSVPYVMDRRDSLDVDEALDLQLVECLLTKGRQS